MPLWQIIAAAVVVFAIFLIARRLFNGEDRIREVDHRGSARPDHDHAELGQRGSARLYEVDPELEQRLADTIRSQGKIHAIKDLKEATGWGLKEAKDYVDNLERNMPPASGRILSTASSTPTPRFESARDLVDGLSRGDRDRVLAEIRNDRKISAIKELRALTGLGLKESKDAVEEIERLGLHL